MLNTEKFKPCIPHEQIVSELSETQAEELFTWLGEEEILQSQPIGGIYISDLSRWIDKYNGMTEGIIK